MDEVASNICSHVVVDVLANLADFLVCSVVSDGSHDYQLVDCEKSIGFNCKYLLKQGLLPHWVCYVPFVELLVLMKRP